jgi:hypothetical protein
MLSIHIRLGLPGGLFPSGFPTNNLYTFLFSLIRATCPAHLILLYTTKNASYLKLSNLLTFLKNHLLEIGLSVVDWIGLVQDRYRWRALVNAVMNLRVP